MSGQIIIVNGTSGSGKTTACELFVQRSDEFWLTYGIDNFLGSTFPKKFGHRGERCDEGIYTYPLDKDAPDGTLRWGVTEQGMKAFGVFHEWVAAAARGGCNIIIDHFLLSDPPLMQDLIWRLEGLPVLCVTLKPDYDVLMERIEKREIGSRFANSSYSSEEAQKSKERLKRLRPWFYEEVYKNEVCDLEIDTVKHSAEEVCEMILRRMTEGPGTAFDKLRNLYPR